jgi:hypothetical protein
MPVAPRLSPNDLLKVLAEVAKPQTRNALSALTGMSLPSVSRYLQPLLLENKIHISHTRVNSTGGMQENFFMIGPAPDGHVPRPVPVSEEELAAKIARRKEKQREHNRAAKKRRREREREAREAKKATPTDDALDWVDPKWEYKPSKLAWPALVLTKVWNSAIKGESHETSTQR